MYRIISSFLLFVVFMIGCSDSQNLNGSTSAVPATDVTRSMVGHWGTDNGLALIITLEGEQVIISAPENDTWRMEIMDAKIVGGSLHFVQKNFLHNGEAHPFNGAACNSVAKMINGDKLELGITTIHSPKFESDILNRIQ